MKTSWLSESLQAEMQGWRADESTFLNIPLTRQSVSKADGYRLINQVLAIIEGANSSSRKPTVGLSFEDPKNWIISIIAAQLGNVVMVPIPKEFTTSQIKSFVPELDFILTDTLASADRLAQISKCQAQVTNHTLADGSSLVLLKAMAEEPQRLGLPANSVSIIHTSGSTDSPKGVVISDRGLECVIRSMLERTSQLGRVHYVSILPFSLLLEQILGIYLPILTKGSIAILPQSTNCYIGTQESLNPYLETIERSGANFAMVPPAFLNQLRKHADVSRRNPREYFGGRIKVVATGGAPIDVSCLEYFRDNQVEIYQGYGLSENTSVVAWNYPGPNVLGSVGRPLGHTNVRINAQSQIEVSGESVLLGYVNGGEFSTMSRDWLNTGDFGHFDENGNLHVTGRDSNLIVLSSGRNVAPEWIESQFRALPGVKDLVVVGHGKPYLAALILADKNSDLSAVMQDVEAHASKVADQFPKFVRLLAFKAVHFDDQYYSVSGRILRAQVLESCADWIDNLYRDRECEGVPECKTISS